MVDVTVAITAHNEGALADLALQSVGAAMACATHNGFSVECLVGLDRANAETRSPFQADLPFEIDVTEFDFGDQGLSRNALAKAANGEYLAFLDADDLFSENWLCNALQAAHRARNAGRKAIVHPEVNWQFGMIHNVYSNPASDDPFFSPHVLATANYYDALCLAPTEAFRQYPFPKRDIQSGFAMEDYQWFVEMSGRGWSHEVAEDTIIFKRRRKVSQSAEARGNFAKIRPIAPLAIDALKNMKWATD